jgi:hypothetical protein
MCALFVRPANPPLIVAYGGKANTWDLTAGRVTRSNLMQLPIVSFSKSLGFSVDRG